MWPAVILCGRVEVSSSGCSYLKNLHLQCYLQHSLCKIPYVVTNELFKGQVITVGRCRLPNIGLTQNGVKLEKPSNTLKFNKAFSKPVIGFLLFQTCLECNRYNLSVMHLSIESAIINLTSQSWVKASSCECHFIRPCAFLIHCLHSCMFKKSECNSFGMLS